MNKLIAVGEVIPAIDLGLPKGVTLAALYDTVDDTLELLLELIKGIKEIPSAVEDAVKDFIKAAKPSIPTISDLTDAAFPDLESKQQFLADYNDCLAGYNRDIPTLAKNEITKQAYLLSCLTQKGYARQLLAAIPGLG